MHPSLLRSRVPTRRRHAAGILLSLALAGMVTGAEIHRDMLSYWPLDTAAGGLTPDLVAGNNLTLNLMDETNLVPGQMGQAMSFDGVEEYLYIIHAGDNGLPIATAPAFTIAMWVNGNGAAQPGGADRRVFSEGSTTSNTPLFNIGTDSQADAALRTGVVDIFIRNNTAAVVNHVKTQGTAFDSQWHHIAWVRRGDGTATVYIDGVADPTAYNYTLGAFTADTLSIGGILRAAASNWFAGLIDEVAIWERSLTADEVAAVMNAGVPLPIEYFPPTIAAPPQGVSARMGDRVTLNVRATGRRPLTYAWTKDGQPLPAATAATLVIPVAMVADSGLYSVTVTNADGSTATEPVRVQVAPDPEPAVAQGLVSYWPFDIVEEHGADPATTPDLYSRNDMALNMMSAANLIDSPHDKALSFDGLNQYAYRVGGFAIAGNPAYTISFWVRGDGTAQNDLRVFAEGSSTSNTPLVTFGTSNDTVTRTMRVYIRNDDNTNPVARLSTTEVFDNEWHHVMWIDNAGAAKLYVDGVQDATDFNYTRGVLTLNRTAVGAILRAAASHWCLSEVDEVAVWNRALTYSEMQEVFSSGIEPPTEPIAPQVTRQPVGATLWEATPFSFSVEATGTSPLAYQWYKDGAPLPGETGTTLDLFEATADEAGIYHVTVQNVTGAAQSDPAELVVRVVEDATTGMVAYWPFEEVGATTPDLVNDNDMNLFNMDATNQVAGRFGQALSFNGTDEYLARIHDATTVGLPLYSHPYYTIAFWVKGLGEGQTDRRVFSEGSTTSQSPLLNVGTDNTGATGVVDIYIRNDTDMGTPVNHAHSTGIAFDNEWRHVAVTDANGAFSIYIDGVRDATSVTYTRGQLTANTTSIGGIQRAAPSHWFAGIIDEVVLWERALSPAEIRHVMANGPVPEPPEIVFTGMGLLAGGDLGVTFESQHPDREHRLEQAASAALPVWAAIPGATLTGPTGAEFQGRIPAPAAAAMVYRAVNIPPPPPFSDDFESGNTGWTHGGPGDNWELGVPTSGPGTAVSGQNVWATGLAQPYFDGAAAWLHSPVIDLRTVTDATLSFMEYRDVEPLFSGIAFDYTTLNVLDADNLAAGPIAVLIAQDVGTTPRWTKRAFGLGPEVLGKRIVLEFLLTTDTFQEQPMAGWFLDDVMIVAE